MGNPSFGATVFCCIYLKKTKTKLFVLFLLLDGTTTSEVYYCLGGYTYIFLKRNVTVTKSYAVCRRRNATRMVVQNEEGLAIVRKIMSGE